MPHDRTFSVRVLDGESVDGRRTEMLDLAMRAKAGWGYDAAFMSQFDQVMRDSLAADDLTVLLAEDDDRLLGFATVALARDPVWLEDLWVEPARQHGGVGTALLDAVVALAGARGASAVECESDPNAEPFYVSRGCRRVGLHPSTIDARRLLPTMRLDLTGS